MAKKARIKKILVEQILDKANIPYETIVFSGGMNRNQAELDAYGLTDHDIYKTLALDGNVTGPVIGIVPVDNHLNEKKLAAVSGNKKVNMIPTKDLQKTTGYIHGANNPVGIWQTKKFPIYFDNSAKEAGTITISAGEVGRSIRIDAETLAQFVHAKFADIRTVE
ncbi:aminoacyl-tRNA deacylase [Weissella paramesenteroides]|jgi:Cys-tRNA(Pro)/Cys-tRNA(Cys) deacylase|uniref:aminoacyl-tRNA deacylase n=1 Tax=Weissella paramesenteroides TaxID=1249 RepID=UPI0020745E4C|nr:aminoacyl-tRNA deacylase [Weissella paramesenteroides]MCM6766380.1 aminoacyl-tRNA deacylase [Weissella paramesenteroides]MCM6767756.1 aminoacyl-tRNA deacylase [Weissella paramesenteroides]MCM6768397.1 aminoacyl-tRNA deacylase [Weissella paramesenteroides]MCM6770471.1 aminoacyl-tRNA deacylase [Weissella paramesenteroides]MCM6780394.1 aminoacyl-tRNA deacylase [Weissella paramesenteroides]